MVQARSGASCTNSRLDDVWSLTLLGGGDGAWMQLTPAGAYPDGRVQHDAIYDSVNQQMIVSGGQNSSGSLGALTLALPACL